MVLISAGKSQNGGFSQQIFRDGKFGPESGLKSRVGAVLVLKGSEVHGHRPRFVNFPLVETALAYLPEKVLGSNLRPVIILTLAGFKLYSYGF